MALAEILPLVLPLIAIQLVLIVVAIRDLMKADRRVRGESKVVWAVVIVAFGLVGPALYLVWGRREG